jgi:hypothetical protein
MNNIAIIVVNVGRIKVPWRLLFFVGLVPHML